MGKTIKKKSSKQRTKAEQKKFRQKAAINLILVIGVCSLVTVLVLFAMAPGEEEEVVLSTFTLKSGKDGEDISWVNIELWTDLSTATFDEWDDILTYTNWEMTIEGAANTLEVNITGYTNGFWIRIDDSTGYFEEEWFYSAASSEQQNITLWSLHRPSDLIFNNLNSTDLVSTIPSNNTDEDYRIITRFPGGSANQLHVGGSFTATLADYALNTAYYQDQANWRLHRPKYILSDDTYNDYSSTSIECGFTEAFGFRFTANDTISTINGNVTQINATISTDYATTWNTQIIDDAIYMYCLGSLVSDFKLEYSMSLNNNITIDSIESGICSIPALVIDDFTAY